MTEPTRAAGPQPASSSLDRELVIRDLHVVPIADPKREILSGIDLTVAKGEVHAIMGPNGSGKTTLSYALMGHPAYTVTKGEVLWKGQNILKLSPDKRARLGLFLAFQYPTAIPGLSVASFLRTALNARSRGLNAGDGEIDPSDMTRGGISMGDFRRLMREKMALLKLDDTFVSRYVNDGFSGGEKKRLEMLQMAVLQPEMAILDETDSGLDIDALRIVADGRQRPAQPRARRPAHHPLPAPAQPHHARLRPRPGPRQDHPVGRARPGPAPRVRGLRPGPPRGRLRGGGGGARQRRRAGAGDHLGMTTHVPVGEVAAAAVARLDPVAIRADFPIFERDFGGRRLAYLDSAATALKPRVVIDAVDGYNSRYSANVHRGIYTIGEEATAAYEGARTAVARFINAADRHEIVFVRNATEAINLVAYTWGRQHIHSGDTIVLTELEHHSNLVPWQLLAQERDADLEFVPIDDEGRLLQATLRGAPAHEAPPGGLHPRLERPGDDQPGARDGGGGARGRRAGPGRWGAGGAPPAGRRAGPGLRLLRLQRPQDPWPDGLRGSLGAARAAGIDAARSWPVAR